MKNNKYFTVVVLLSVLLVVGCKSSKPVVTETKNEIVKKVTETVHDTVFKIEKDSSAYKALLECQNGKIKIKEILTQKPGKNLKPPKVDIKNNEINIDCEAYAQKLLAQYKSKNTQVTQVKTVPIKVNELTFWQEFQIRGFRLLSLIAIAIIGRRLIKFYFKV